MKSPSEVLVYLKKNIKKEWKVAFWSTVLLGLLIHMPMMLRDIPNHDGLDSMHFNQNMIVSGRWFLSVACGISSYYTIPWLIGILAMIYLGLTSVFLVDFLEVKESLYVVLISGLLVSFPALASTFAYVFTMDGYMLAVFLAVLAVWITKKKRLGFVSGAVCLALSMAIYQAYLPFAILLSIYGILMLAMEEGDLREKFLNGLHYFYMGMLGTTGYYVVLQIMLKIQHTEIGTYQEGNSLGMLGSGLLGTIKNIYMDFFAFTFNGNVLMNNLFSITAFVLLGLVTLITLIRLVGYKDWWKKSVWFYVICVLLVMVLPLATNIMMLILPGVTYHLLMRFHWILYPILMIGFVGKYNKGLFGDNRREWVLLVMAGTLVWNFVVTDQIAYTNLQKKYEKTYSYCVRLLDRIEQTEGYYPGIPIAMIGVVGEDEYPPTDITGPVTSNLIGMNGEFLLYTGNNYELFMKHYLGATLNILPSESMAEMYYSPEYREMESFPAKDSIRIINGIMYIKTENKE
ncbi:MAG: glucosyltransferase domain-containing protein [Lachnospiraceae bacterium]|nr:glucosyltransferase domain-containing protein [Lachnospiraceae bacterium]